MILPRPWTRQPQYPAQIDWSNPLAEKLEYVLLGSQRFANPSNLPITRSGAILYITGNEAVGADIQETQYESYLLPAGQTTGGTTNWTIAGVFIPATLSGSVGNADGNAVCGVCEAPGTVAAWDRMLYMKNTTHEWRGYLYDGAVKLATSTAQATVGKEDRVIVTTNGATLICAVNGAADASVAVTSNGFNGYTSAEFCVGNPINAGGILKTSVPLLVRTRRYWDAAMRKSFFNNPWQIFAPLQRRIYVPGTGVAPTFKPYFVNQSGVVIGAGVL